MAALIAVVGANVFCRYVLRAAIPWAEEAARYIMVYMAYLAAPLALRGARHVRIGLLTHHLRGGWAAAAEMFSNLMVAGLALAVVWQGRTLIQMVSFQRTPALDLPMSVPYFAVVLGAGFLAVEAAVLFVASAARALGLPSPRLEQAGLPEIEGKKP